MTPTHRPPAAPRITHAQVEDIREAVRDALEQSSLRTLAPEIGIGHSTLHNFASGATPHPRVRRLLFNWHVRHKATPRSITPEQLDAITASLPQHVRSRLRPRIAEILVSGYVEGGVETPSWLEAAASAGP